MTHAQLTISEWAAWWGASIATFVFTWDIYKWRTAKAKLSIAAKENKQTACDIDVFVTNVGVKATTLRRITGCYLSKNNRSLAETNSYFPNGQKLPFVLQPGGFWSCQLTFKKPLPEAEINDGSVVVEIYEGNQQKPRKLKLTFKKLHELRAKLTSEPKADMGAMVG